ncbi:CPBP family intramembrane glutamic endopeptidase [Rathayibacter soli]|uniref:CPBP family intramembrane glutamic endopeptidase n=1 Tax=Rathayibacter soli TaxID=3144168 RepID=UPI0027E45761|nr:type II CAAX endopeptidase family protein [Glaciibacter superstes]
MTSVEDTNRLSRATSRSPLVRHPLISFFVIAYVLAWLIEVPLALSANGILPRVPRLVFAIAIPVATFAPAASAFIVTGLTEGKVGVVRLLRRCVRWRVGIQWYLFILIGIPIIIILGTIVVPGAVAYFRPVIGPLLAAYPLAFVVTFFLGGPLGEEPGWRGFALPRLQSRVGPLRGSLILGVLWALWHFPLFWSGVWTPPTIPNMVMFIVMITGLTIIMTWVFNHARGSVLITMLMHASFNTFANKIAAPLFPAPIFNEYGLLPVMIGFTVTALVLIVVTRGRLGYGTSAIPLI